MLNEINQSQQAKDCMIALNMRYLKNSQTQNQREEQ